MLIATKLGKAVNYLIDLFTIKFHEPLVTWPCEVT